MTIHVGSESWRTDWRPGYAIQERFTASIEADWLPYRVELDLAVNERDVSCAGLRLEAPEGGEITARPLRDVPLGECIRLATMAAMRPVAERPGELVIQLGGPSTGFDASDAATLAARGPQRRVTDSTLREVADIYQRAERNPTQAVQHEHTEGPISHSTAARWVMEARKRGYLPPAQRKGKR